MSKQPGQIKADYKKTEKIIDQCKKKIEGGYTEEKTGKRFTYPIIDISEFDKLIEVATEQRGVLKDNMKYVKSKEKNNDYQEKLTENIQGLEEKKNRNR